MSDRVRSFWLTHYLFSRGVMEKMEELVTLETWARRDKVYAQIIDIVLYKD